MSCGQPHDTDCSEVLAELWLFLDDECDPQRRQLLQRHLDECAPCLAEFGVEEQLKALLARKCGGDHAPDSLKQRLRASIRETLVAQMDGAVRTTEVTVTQQASGAAVTEVRTEYTQEG